jgi:ERCC4-type nuclease
LNFAYNDAQIKKVLATITILTDTREQKNQHIIKWFDDNKIAHKSQKLDVGDYSCSLTSYNSLGLATSVQLSDSIVIERKGSLEELSGNFSHDRERFEKEMIRNKGKLVLMIENANGFANIANHNYKTELSPGSFIGSLLSFQSRYGVIVQFLPREMAGLFIYRSVYYHTRNLLKGGLL